MPCPPELELVDQLLGGDMPHRLVCTFFRDEAHARRVLAVYISRGVVVLSEESGELPAWRSQEILRSPQPLVGYEKTRVGLTDKGAKAFQEGGWEKL
jgi:hypothetical protein